MEPLQTSDPGPHVAQVRHELAELVLHLRSDVDKISDPKAVALFETAAEVLAGVERAFGHFATKTEKAWRQ